MEREYANEIEATKRVAFHRDRRAEISKRLTKGYNEQYNKFVANVQNDDADVCAANTANFSLQATLNNISKNKAERNEIKDAMSALMQGPTTTQTKRKAQEAVDNESPAPEAGRTRSSGRGRDHKRNMSRSKNAFGFAFTPSLTVQK